MLEEERSLTVDQFPDDPLKMPPPYWRGGGAIFHIQDALEELVALLQKLIPFHADTKTRLNIYYENNPVYNESDEEANEKFYEIIDD